MRLGHRRAAAPYVTATAGLLVALLSGCDSSTTQPGSPPPPASTDAGNGWNTIAAGGETVCSDGSDYQFFVRHADPTKLVVYFQGGGACWFGRNCDPHLDPSYKQVVEDGEMARYRGIFERDNPENPFADYSFVVAPYCTADVHIGNNVATYEAPAREAGDEQEAHQAHAVTIHHKGIVNALAVLDWTFDHFTGPAEIFVTGSSAGAIPSPYYAWKIADHYPDARIAQLGDAAGGYRRSADVNLARMEQWGTMEHLSKYPEFADMPPADFTYEHLYIAAARRHPDILFAEYDAAEDEVQKRFLAMGGRDTTTLKELILANHADIRAEVDNFRAYVAGGDSHTILARPEFYTFQVAGRRIRDWVADLARFKPVQNIVCERCGQAELVPGAAPRDGGQ